MYRNPNEENIKAETTEEFLARGGKIEVCQPRGMKKENKVIDVQHMLNSVETQDEFDSVIKFLDTKGIKVEFEE